ncbi:hypothetical protein ACA910_017081 [Epithemia clementina (nom. ined.)]
MHPLDQTIETSFHRPRIVERRRSSLDNSSLAAPESFAALLLFPREEQEDYARKAPRRLSLGTKLEVTNTTFLAMSSNKKRRNGDEKTKDLDSDRHESNHNPTSSTSRTPRSSHSKDTVNTALFSSDEESTVDHEEELSEADDDDDDDEDSLDDSSACDSFCDASAEEPANRTYLRTELGASVMWGDDSADCLDFLHDSWRGDSGSQEHRQGAGDSSSGGRRGDHAPLMPMSPGAKMRAMRSSGGIISRSFSSASQPSPPLSHRRIRNLSLKLAD